MKPKMRQKATRQKSRRCKSKRQKVIRRTYKKVIKGGDPTDIKWNKNGKKGDDNDTIILKINKYLDTIEGLINKFFDNNSLISWLNIADEAIKRFEAQLSNKENIDEIISPLKKRASDVKKKLNIAISGIQDEYTPLSRTLVPEIEHKHFPAPKVNDTNFRSTQFNGMSFGNMMNTLQRQKNVQNASTPTPLINSSQKTILKTLF